MLKIIFTFFPIIIIVSCSSLVEPEKIKTGSEFYPLAVGNYWKYEGSFSSKDSSYVFNYKSVITQVEIIGGFEWSKIESARNNYTQNRYLLMENDSIYELQYNWRNPIRALVYIIPKNKKESFHSILGGDVGITKTVEKLDTAIHTKIGIFTNCFRYKCSTLDWTEIEILAYGIGIVERQLIHYNFMTGEQISKTTEIVEEANINNAR
jgi:hypothetical protein